MDVPVAKKPGVLRSELVLWVGGVTTILFLAFGDRWLADLSRLWWFAVLFVWLFGIMLWLAFGVVRHADSLTVLLGEPYGTLVLTLAVINIEVTMISAVMLTGDNNPTLARDTMFAVLMIVLNGVVGVTLLLGGLRHHEQVYNLQGASAYLGVIVPLAVLCLVLPRFTPSAPGGQVSTLMAAFLVPVSIGLYAVFLAIQTIRHSDYFKRPDEAGGADDEEDHHAEAVRSVPYHASFLVLTMLPVVLLAKKLAVLVDYGIETRGAPPALGGFIVATLVLAPEGLAAVKAALANRLQRTVNIALGTALSTIGLTIPAVLTISLITGATIELGLEPDQIVMLVVTLLVSMVNFAGGRTNILQGAVHVILLLAYVVLIFD
jgi:Ca2+:H+ antiporter